MVLHADTVLLILAVIWSSSLNANATNYQDFQFDVEPSSVTTFDGHTAEFHCIAPCSGIFWLINNEIAQAVWNIAKQTETVPRTDGQEGQESTLRITATVPANNSVIKCGVEDRRTNSETYSSPAHLIIQGLLSPPTNIQLELWLTNQYLTVFLYWDQPFTFNITSPPSDNIISYRVFVSRINDTALEVYNTSSTQFTYNYSAADTNCNNFLHVTFQLSAINRVGISERSDPLRIICNTGRIQTTTVVRHHSTSSTANPPATVSTTPLLTTDLVPKPTVYQEPMRKEDTRTIIIVTTATSVTLILIALFIVICLAVINRKRANKNETTLPPSISLELNINNAYDHPCRQGDFETHLEMIPMKDLHDIYSEVEPPETIYDEIAT